MPNIITDGEYKLSKKVNDEYSNELSPISTEHVVSVTEFDDNTRYLIDNAILSLGTRSMKFDLIIQSLVRGEWKTVSREPITVGEGTYRNVSTGESADEAIAITEGAINSGFQTEFEYQYQDIKVQVEKMFKNLIRKLNGLPTIP